MRRVAFLAFCLCILSLPALSGLAQSVVGSSLENTVREIAAEEGVELAYDAARLKALPAPRRVPAGKSLARLQALLEPYDLTVEWVQAPKAVIVNLPPPIRGVVVDRASGAALPYARVDVLNGPSVLANPKGRFRIRPGNPEIMYPVVVSYLGYQPDTQLIKPSYTREYRVTLAAAPQMLQEVRIEDGMTQQLKVSDAASQASINPRMISTLSGLGEPDIFRAAQLLPGIQAGGLSNGGLQIRGGTSDQTLVRFDGITAYRVDHFFGLFGAFNSRAVRNIDVYRGGYQAQFGGRVSGVVDIEGRNGNFEKPRAELGINLFNSSLLVETPLWKNKVSLLIAGRQSYTDVVESPFYRRFFSNVFAPPEEVARESAREVWQHGSNSVDFLDTYQQTRFDPQSVSNLPLAGANTALTRSPVDFRTVNRDYLRESAEPSFRFSDWHLRLAIRPSARDLITLSGFKGTDFLSYSYNDQPRSGIDVEILDELKLQNRGGSLRWKRQWQGGLISLNTVAVSEHTNDYRYRMEARDDSTRVGTALSQTHGIRDMTFRSDNTYRASATTLMKFGMEASVIRLRYGMGAGDTLFLGQRSRAHTLSFYAEHHFTPVPQFRITTGMRSTYFSNTRLWSPEPRVQLRYIPKSPWRFKAAWGVYNQFLSRIRMNNGLGLGEDFYAFGGNGEVPVTVSSHYILGGAWEKNGWLIDIEAYLKNTRGLVTYAFRPDMLELHPDGNGELIGNGESRIQGVEVLVQKRVGAYTGWVSYSLSKGWQRFPDINKGASFPTMQDQRHELKVINQLKLNRWELAATWIWASGRPYTEATDTRTIDSEPEHEVYELIIGERNAARLPMYHRLDISATYHWKIGDFPVETGISVYNAYNRTNIRQRRFVLVTPNLSWQSPTVSRSDVYDLGFSPNIFWKMRF